MGSNRKQQAGARRQGGSASSWVRVSARVPQAGMGTKAGRRRGAHSRDWLGFGAGAVECGRKTTAKPFGGVRRSGPLGCLQGEMVQVQRGLGGVMGKCGTHRPTERPFLLPLPLSDPAELQLSLTCQALGAARPWHRTGSATAKTPGLTRRPRQRAAAGRQRLSGQWWEKVLEEVAQALSPKVASWG